MEQQKKSFKQRCVDLWKYFTTYEKIWFFSILILAIVFAFIFPETDEPTYTVTLDNSSFVQVQGGESDIYELNFTGTTGEYVIVNVTISQLDENGEVLLDGRGKKQEKKYKMSELVGYGEHTVDPEDEDSLTLKLATYNKKTDQYTPIDITHAEISFECYFDGDDEQDCQLVVSVVNTENNQVLYESTAITLDLEQFESNTPLTYKLKENSFLVAVGWITVLYVLDVILNIACELLISKQSKWNFVVSLGVEIVEILVCIFCLYRFATMAVTLLFWIPCDIISFVMWHRHPDKQKEELTIVKKLTPWQDVIIITAIAVWTVGVGYLLTLIEVDGGIFATNVTLKNIVCYIDACASAVGIANGLLILFRYREQWIAWYIVAILETVINIIAGQWILLILKAGYLTNTTYGYIKWTQYIKRQKEVNSSPIGTASVAEAQLDGVGSNNE
ncbi:MAG: nicotinamide mononucleotide transporter [Clostridiales bacterium]|nr:nicotinamide mononucleotide transporter [Clostridiales bacterium]